MIRLNRIACGAAAVLVALAPAPAALAAERAAEAQQWANAVWNAALEGDREALEGVYFQAAPEFAEGPLAERFAAQCTLHRANASRTDEHAAELRATTAEELEADLAEGDLSAALEDAVKIQTYSDDYAEILDDPTIARLVADADAAVGPAEEAGDWLLAQELLFRLRALHEDIPEVAGRFEAYDERLSAVNRQISLLAYYAPRALHELRQTQRARRGDDPLPEYDPENAPKWRERLEGIRPKLVKQAVRTAVNEHIDEPSMRTLIEGGLDAMLVVGRASGLAITEDFAGLGDPIRVAAWLQTVDDLRSDLESTPDGRLKRELDRVLASLILTNDETIGLPERVILREFGDGAMARLDEYSEVIWPDKLRRFQQQTEGNFIGVGIVIRENESREIMVVNPLEGTPAYRAKIKPGDIISSVDGNSTAGWSLNDAVDRITGPRGTEVTLGIDREGEDEQLDIRVVRDRIKLRSVKGWFKLGLNDRKEPVWDWFVDPDAGIAYVKLTQFSDDTYEDLMEAWNEITLDGPVNGLILDLRYNPGGLLPAAVHIANLFVPRGEIVSVEDRFKRRLWSQQADPMRAPLSEVPTVVLVNKGSASASEIVAGCIQAHGQGVIIGERSYGKGSVQTVHTMSRDAKLKVTTQYYRLPSTDGRAPGRLVHKRPGTADWGVNPDLEVRMTPHQIEESYKLRQEADLYSEDDPEQVASRPDVNDLLTEGLDPQIEMALLLLQARALGDDRRPDGHVRLPSDPGT